MISNSGKSANSVRDFVASAWQKHFHHGRGGRLKLAISIGAGARLISVAAALITTPIIVRYLGNEGYGLMITITSVTAWLQISDLGLGLGLQNALTEAVAHKNRAAQKTLISTCAFGLLCIGVTLLVTGLVAHHFVDWLKIFRPTTERYASQISPTVLIVIIGFVTSFVLGFIAPIYAARQELHLQNSFNAIANLLSLSGVLIAVSHNWGLVGVTACSVGITAAVNWIFALWYLYFHGDRALRPELKSISRAAWSRIYRSGAAFLVIQICVIVLFQTDAFLITQLLSAEGVAPYAVAQKLFGQLLIAFGLLCMPLWAAYGNARSLGDTNWIRRTHRRILRLFAIVYILVFIFVPIFGQRGFELWVGRAAAPSMMLLLALAAYYCIRQWADVHAILINGLDFVRPQAISAVVHTAITLTLNIILIRRLGVIGAAIGGFAGYALVSGWFLPLLAKHALNSIEKGQKATEVPLIVARV